MNMKSEGEEALQLTGKPKHIDLPQEDIYDDDIYCYGKCCDCCGVVCGCLRTWLPCICCCWVDYPYKTVPQSYEGIYEKFGRYRRSVKPGLHYINPCSQSLQIVNMKINVMDLSRQFIITKDNVSISIDAAVYYRRTNARYSYYRIQNASSAIAQVTYAILKNTCGQFILQDLLEKRQEIADDLERQVDKYVRQWGLQVQQIFIKDILLSKDLQESLSSAAKERRLAQSKIIAAQADVDSAKLMRQAAEELNSKAAMQIRYLETVKGLGKQKMRVIFIPNINQKERVQHMVTQGMIE